MCIETFSIKSHESISINFVFIMNDLTKSDEDRGRSMLGIENIRKYLRHRATDKRLSTGRTAGNHPRGSQEANSCPCGGRMTGSRPRRSQGAGSSQCRNQAAGSCP